MSAAATATQHLYPLITDLGLILMTAGVSVLLFRKIRQPLVLGYLIAGFLAGNHFDFFPSVTDMQSVRIWAEIGIIFLLFSLGLEFSFKKLVKVGGTAFITAIVQIAGMVVVGFGVGKLMGWEQMDCLFLGVMLSISSTTIILKTYDELGVKSRRFAGNVIGALIVQDILAILMMVLLSTAAVSRQFSGGELLMSVFKLVFFLVLWFLGGIFFIPTLLKRAKSLLTDEMLLILAIALCLMMVILASNVGFSPALGAFIMGSIIAETTQAEHIEHLVKPVKDLFGAVFFVSVGMLIQPNSLIIHAVPVGILTFVVIFGQSVFSTLGALISGQPLKTSVQTGMSLSQIGEFSFIIATLGVSLGVTSDFLYPIVVAVSAVTTFTTPFMVRWSEPFAHFLNDHLPKKWIRKIERYSTNAQSIKSASNWQIVLRAYIMQVVIHSVVIVAIILLSARFVLPLVAHSHFGNIIAAVGTLVVLAPFLWALALRRVAVDEVLQLMQERRYRGPIIMMILFRFLLTLFFLGFLLNNFFSPIVALVTLVVAVVLYLLFPTRINRQYHRIETHFMKNLNARELLKNKRARPDLMPWESHMSFFDIAAGSNVAGKSLAELHWREQFGINIAFIKRGDFTVKVPGRNERIFPADEICVIGTDEQLKDFKLYLDKNEMEITPAAAEADIVMRQIQLTDPDFTGKTIRQSQLRERTSGLIVGLERKGKRLLNPDSLEILEPDDVLWIVGDRKLLAAFQKSQQITPVSVA